MIKSYIKIVILFLCVFVWGCGRYQTVGFENTIGTARHHVQSGFRLLEKGYLEDAGREFDLALRADEACSSAFRGKALLMFSRGSNAVALEYLERALVSANTNEDKALAHAGFMQVLRKEKKADCADSVVSHFRDAVLSVTGLPEAYFELGLCFKESHDFKRSREAFQRVVEMRSRLTKDSEIELSLLHKIRRADPKNNLVVELALKPFLTRAELCMILVREMGLPGALARSRGDTIKPYSIVTSRDANEHRFSKEIDEIAKMELSGLSFGKDGHFEPDAPVTRADFVSLISDLIARISGSRRIDEAFGEDFLDRELSRGDSAKTNGADILFVLKKIREKYPVFD